MIIGLLVEFGVGMLCIVMGLLIWKKERISLIHDYHFRNVRKEDIPSYCRLIGIGLILIGAGICITGILDLSGSAFWWIPMLSGMITGILVMNRAQKRYNGSWFD